MSGLLSMTVNVHNAQRIVKAKSTPILCIVHFMENDTRPDPAKRLQVARERAGFGSAKAAAIRFGWNYETYAQHENGTRGIIRAAARYAAAFKVSPGWLLTGDGPGPGEHAAAIARLSEIYAALPPDLRDLLMNNAEAAALAVKARKQG